MATFDKSRLRNTLRKLRAVEAQLAGDYDPLETGQEMLDLLAVLDGLKPVFLHGRGLVDAPWMTGVVDLARSLGLRVIQGPCWNPLPPGESFPAWYAECVGAEFDRHHPFYICKAPSVAREVAAVNDAGGHPTIGQEARLLGYPECCVAAHHARAGIYHRYVIERMERLAGGDEARARALYGRDIDLSPESDADEAALAVALDIVPCPFGSWNACVSCVDEEESPSIVLSDEYEGLAEAIDPALAELLRPREEDQPAI